MNFFSPNRVQWTRFSDHKEQPKETIEGESFDDYFLGIRFNPDWHSNVMLEWEVPEEWAAGDPVFMVYMSESESGPFRAISGEPFKEAKFKAYETMNAAKTRDEFWIVQASMSDGSVYRTQPVSICQHLPRWQWLRYMEVIRREKILLDKFAGVKSVVFKRREYGTRCPNCWDSASEKIIKDRCEVCYGTSFEGGYLIGVETKIQYDPTTSRKQYAYFGKMEPNQITGWTINYPVISPHDIIIRLSDFRVFRVEAMQNTEMMSRPLRQIMQLTELPRNHIESKLLSRGDPWEEFSRDPHIHH